jgi:hypothetical protein
MIHDAIVEVTCDGENCRESTYISLPAGVRNTYIAEDSQIERQLEQEEWIVSDGNHYCSRECQEES